jgi:hypothetical protein
MKTQQKHIAYFITPHGYGHAARASAIMETILKLDPEIHFEIFTLVPPWFFEDSLPVNKFDYHEYPTDVGLVQTNPLHENLIETVNRLRVLIPFSRERINQLVDILAKTSCELVLCDIAPLGIAVGKAAGLPIILIENFTWDWIYSGYLKIEPRLSEFINYLKDVFTQADYHIQTTPACSPTAKADLTTGVIARGPRNSIAVTRNNLGILPGNKVVLLSMGGIEARYAFLNRLKRFENTIFIIPDGSRKIETDQNLLLLPHHSSFYHPDLVLACDLVIAKLGYSTLAESYHSGVPMIFISRPDFRESSVLSDFALREIGGFEIPANEFQNGEWISALEPWMYKPRRQKSGINGAEQAADLIIRLLK